MARKASSHGHGKKAPARTSAPEAASARDARDPRPPSFSVVAIGASAGGLEAFRELFAALPATTGMAFILIQHLDPRHKSLLPEILSRNSTMPVTEVTDGMRVEPNQVFVMPPNVRMTISDRILGLAPRQTERHHLPIDRFFFSLAADQRSRAIGIVLSGTDEDGTKGSRAIKAAGGMTFAQDQESAQFETMPRSAVEKGSVDLVLPPAKIAAELVRLAAHQPISGRDPVTTTERPSLEIKKEDLEGILAMMRKSFKADFSQYKLPTLRRRVLRRMAMQKKETVEEYRDYLEAHSGEVELLYRDILIGVTGFFRDSERFKVLKSVVFPEILKRRAPDDSIRVWVPACSTGEEAYSIAIALTEFLGEKASHTAVQVFATDINGKSLEKGRAGLYGEHVAESVSAERLGNFFVKSAAGYTISKRIREMVIFAPQDLIKDPPFSRMDLLSCCNVLIYLEPEVHKRVIPLLHYSLKPSGFLMLGSSEGIGSFSDHFEVIDNKYKIYRKSWSSVRPIMNLLTTPSERGSAPRIAAARPVAAGDAQREASRLLLARFAPAGAIVDEGLDIIQFHGDAGPFLSPAAGAVSFNLFKMVREELLPDLRAAVQKAKRQLAPVRKEHIRFRERNQPRLVNLEVVPYKAGENRYFLVLFEESQTRTKVEPKERASKSPPGASRKAVQLSQELEAMREYVRTIMEDHERIESDIHAASEELQSSNEELQSTNEELETAKEEVQSANEELTTLNEELGNQNRELIQLGDDMANLLGSVDIAIVIVDGDLRIRRLNKTAEKKLNLIATDIGRPITDLRLPVDLPGVEPLIREVLSTLTMTEHQVQDTEGRWYSLRIRPYRTIRNVIDGVVMTLVDIDDLRRSLGDEKQARERAEAAETRWSLLAEASLLLSSIDYETTLKAVAELATPRFAEWCTVDIAQEDGSIRHLAISHAIPARTDLVTQLRDLSSAGDDTSFGSRVLQTGQAEFLPAVREDASLTSRDPRWVRLIRALDVRSLICVPLTARGKTLGSITFAASGKMRPYDHSDLRLAEELGRRAGLAIDNAQLFKAAGEANRFKDDFLATLSHELRTPMTAVLGWTQLLQLGQLDEETHRRAIDTIETSTKTQLRLIEDLLDISRVTTGKMRLDLANQPLRPVLEAVLETIRPAAEAKRIRIERRFDDGDAVVAGDPIRLEQVFWNLLINAVKFTPPESEIVIELAKEDSFVRIRVRDTGEGIAPTFLPHVFERFRQDDRLGGDLRKGLGLGLAIARQLVELHGGTIEAASPGTGRGATFTVKLPLVV